MLPNGPAIRTSVAKVNIIALPLPANKPGTTSNMAHLRSLLKMLLVPSISVRNPPTESPIKCLCSVNGSDICPNSLLAEPALCPKKLGSQKA